MECVESAISRVRETLEKFLECSDTLLNMVRTLLKYFKYKYVTCKYIVPHALVFK